MKKINFTYQTELDIGTSVNIHCFALRCVPTIDSQQRISDLKLNFVPAVRTWTNTDSFGNTVVSGRYDQPHDKFVYSVSGTAVVCRSNALRDGYLPCYKYQSQMTLPNEEMIEFYQQKKQEIADVESIVERVEFWSQTVNSFMTYEKYSTNVKTTAAIAFSYKKGVCQDYSHLLLSLLRMDGIACRYVAGLAFCDGETHSWVEFFDSKWIGIDPTNNCFANDDYIVLSRGRDFVDCSIDRGVLFGVAAAQSQKITSYLEEIN